MKAILLDDSEGIVAWPGHDYFELILLAYLSEGRARTGRLPDVVTMNRAHGTHYTLFPDPKIPHVLHGWGENGQPAHYAMRIGDVIDNAGTSAQIAILSRPVKARASFTPPDVASEPCLANFTIQSLWGKSDRKRSARSYSM